MFDLENVKSLLIILNSLLALYWCFRLNRLYDVHRDLEKHSHWLYMMIERYKRKTGIDILAECYEDMEEVDE